MKLVRYTPDELLAKYNSIRSQVPDGIFYNRPEYRKTMELWCAAQFARGYAKNLAPCTVWVHEGDAQTYFDFQLENHTHKFNFQLTEVQLPGRRRGDEYSKDGPSGHTMLADWDNGAELGGTWIRSAIEKKRNRLGGDVSELNLLVYINYPAIEHPFFELRNQVAAAAAHFRSVWLLSGHAIACMSSKDSTFEVQQGWMFIPDDPHAEP